METYLRSNGAPDIWIDLERIGGGDQLTPAIIEAIRRSKCCVALLSPDYVASGWCNTEIGAFLGQRKAVIPYESIAGAIPATLQGRRIARTPEEVLAALPTECRDGLQPYKNFQTLVECGMLNAFRIKMQNSERQRRVTELIEEELQSGNKTFFLAASSGFNYLKSNGHVWLDSGLGNAVHNGARFTVVLQSPFCSFALTRALACDKNERHHWEEKVGEQDLQELAKLENVDIHVTECPVNCSVFFTSRSVFFDPYLWGVPESERPAGRPENNFWVFEFRKVDDSKFDCYELLRLHFRFLLEHSEPLESFLNGHALSYKDRTEKFHELVRRLRATGGRLECTRVC